MKYLKSAFDIQGHRGCRGLMPENTIPSFLKAVEIGVTTLEMDVVITSNHQVLVSHEPYMSHAICLRAGDIPVKRSEEKSFNIYKMTAVEAQEFDCGLKVNKNFPGQEKLRAYKPLLTEVIEEVESYVALHKLKPVYYNIEIKCTRKGDGIFHPEPNIFASLVMEVLTQKNIIDRVKLQSFDVRILQFLRKQNAAVTIALLIENLRGVEYNIKKLGFNPDIYSPYYKLLTASRIKFLHDKGIKVIPWTVNSIASMKSLIAKGVDGIITDYPDRLVKVIGH